MRFISNTIIPLVFASTNICNAFASDSYLRSPSMLSNEGGFLDIPEGQTIQCENDTDTLYRWHMGQLRHYPSGQVASSWNENWRDILKTDCTELSVGLPMSANIEIAEGQTIQCENDTDTLYRWHMGQLRHYPSGQVASSWNENWRDILKTDCTELSVGLPMSPKNSEPTDRLFNNDTCPNHQPDFTKIPNIKSDPRFPSLISGFNQRFYANNCKNVYQVNNKNGVMKAVDDIVNYYGQNVRIRSGGHCYENFVMNDETLGIVDVRGLTDWGRDDKKGWYVSSGDTNWSVFEKLFNTYGKILPSGSCYSVGLGGHISGGGDGIMSRLYGTTIDTLTGVEIVVKDKPGPAYAIYVGDDSTGDEADLFWALRGAGNGNFGVITKYYYKYLPPAPKGAIISVVAFEWATMTKDKLKAILDYYVDFASDKDNWASSAKFQIYHEAAGESQMTIHTAYFDDASKREAKIYHYNIEMDLKEHFDSTVPSKILPGHGGVVSMIPSLATGTLEDALNDTVHDLPFYDATQILNSSGPNQRGKYKSAYMKVKFPTEQVDTMFEYLTTYPAGLDPADMKQSLLQIDTFGGQINETHPKAAAYAQREYVVKLQFQTYWVDEKNDPPHLQWIRDFYHIGMYGKYGGVPDPEALDGTMFQGCYYNYPDVDLNEYVGRTGALRLYFLDNYDKNPRNLVQVKCRWDPYNYFNSAQSVQCDQS